MHVVSAANGASPRLMVDLDINAVAPGARESFFNRGIKVKNQDLSCNMDIRGRDLGANALVKRQHKIT